MSRKKAWPRKATKPSPFILYPSLLTPYRCPLHSSTQQRQSWRLFAVFDRLQAALEVFSRPFLAVHGKVRVDRELVFCDRVIEGHRARVANEIAPPVEQIRIEQSLFFREIDHEHMCVVAGWILEVNDLHRPQCVLFRDARIGHQLELRLLRAPRQGILLNGMLAPGPFFRSEE